MYDLFNDIIVLFDYIVWKAMRNWTMWFMRDHVHSFFILWLCLTCGYIIMMILCFLIIMVSQWNLVGFVCMMWFSMCACLVIIYVWCFYYHIALFRLCFQFGRYAGGSMKIYIIWGKALSMGFILIWPIYKHMIW